MVLRTRLCGVVGYDGDATAKIRPEYFDLRGGQLVGLPGDHGVSAAGQQVMLTSEITGGKPSVMVSRRLLDRPPPGPSLNKATVRRP